MLVHRAHQSCSQQHVTPHRCTIMQAASHPTRGMSTRTQLSHPRSELNILCFARGQLLLQLVQGCLRLSCKVLQLKLCDMSLLTLCVSKLMLHSIKLYLQCCKRLLAAMQLRLRVLQSCSNLACALLVLCSCELKQAPRGCALPPLLAIGCSGVAAESCCCTRASGCADAADCIAGGLATYSMKNDR